MSTKSSGIDRLHLVLVNSLLLTFSTCTFVRKWAGAGCAIVMTEPQIGWTDGEMKGWMKVKLVEHSRSSVGARFFWMSLWDLTMCVSKGTGCVCVCSAVQTGVLSSCAWLHTNVMWQGRNTSSDRALAHPQSHLLPPSPSHSNAPRPHPIGCWLPSLHVFCSETESALRVIPLLSSHLIPKVPPPPPPPISTLPAVSHGVPACTGTVVLAGVHYVRSHYATAHFHMFILPRWRTSFPLLCLCFLCFLFQGLGAGRSDL